LDDDEHSQVDHRFIRGRGLKFLLACILASLIIKDSSGVETEILLRALNLVSCANGVFCSTMVRKRHNDLTKVCELMGFFDSLKKKVLRVDDQQLLLEAMLCVAFADGDDQYEETNLVMAFANTLPELKNADAYEVFEKAKKNVKLHGAMARAKELGNLSTDNLKQKAFLLAMDIALSSGEVDEGEEAVLATMAEVMKIPTDVSDRIAQVLSIKYST
jgi:tellurite resistance protein